MRASIHRLGKRLRCGAVIEDPATGHKERFEQSLQKPRPNVSVGYSLDQPITLEGNAQSGFFNNYTIQ
jgi:hypothetical protein